MADIHLSDATILRSAFANDEFGENVIDYPSVIADGVGAVLALNGDYYGFRDTGIVIRNGVAYRDKGARQGMAFLADGTTRLYDETATTASELVAEGVWNTLSFGPGLVAGGSVISGIDSVEIDTNVGNHSVQGRQPRTGIGVLAENHVLFVVVDGRSPGYSRGVTMSEFAQIFVDLGADTAYNLDGGGSSAMIFNSHLVNNPLGKGVERGTSDIPVSYTHLGACGRLHQQPHRRHRLRHLGGGRAQRRSVLDGRPDHRGVGRSERHRQHQ